MRSVAVVVPWRAGCPQRKAVWAWLRPRLEARYQEVRTGTPDDGLWCKADAVTDGLTRTTGQIVVIHDADVWSDGLDQAIQAVADDAPWAIPHWQVHRLTETATAEVLDGGNLGGETEEKPYQGIEGGGIVVLPRSTYERVPLDRRFRGWGHEDEAWAIALTTLAGPVTRFEAPLWHLWHPPQHRPRGRGLGSKESFALKQAYQNVRKRRDWMEQLVDAGR